MYEANQTLNVAVSSSPVREMVFIEDNVQNREQLLKGTSKNSFQAFVTVKPVHL